MDKILKIFQYVVGGFGAFSGAYAVYKLSLYGLAYMNKNPNKVEEAKDGLKNTVVGLLIAMSAAAIVAWIQKA